MYQANQGAQLLTRIKLFTLRYSDTLGGFADEALQQFLRDKSLLAFREHFFCVHDVPHLLCVVSCQESATRPDHSTTTPPSRETRPDPLAGLNESQLVLFDTLRTWRAELAQREGVPPYVILTNRQLAEVVRRLPDSPTALGQVDGIGHKKIERYGKALLELLHGEPTPQTPSEVVK